MPEDILICSNILTCTSAVSPEDRAVIRSRLLESGLEEYDHRLALQNALVIAKISRFEYPNDWYDLFSYIYRQDTDEKKARCYQYTDKSTTEIDTARR